ncbi:MAG: hypothetical protein AUI90_03935 [Deltaproteobacteria bacterium 13_1_40CM_3_69_14]|nr:MAG: hypothetical protein AUI90_03935 [Deltaproteobacteria bacterium 13_1_40CM_3_69_14]
MFLVVVLSVLVVAEDSADLTAGPQARVDVDVCDMAADSLDQRRELAGSDNQSSMPRHGPSFQALEGNGSSRLPREPRGIRRVEGDSSSVLDELVPQLPE